jgi:tetratricopeptide (TPR) repeat protein
VIDPPRPAAPPLPAPRGRRRRLTLLAALLVALGAVGWFGWRWYTAPTVPVFDVSGEEPEVRDHITEARRAVEAEPRSAAAWGHLGHVLSAYSKYDHATLCYAQAESLDGRDPRWPYLQGLYLLWKDSQQAIGTLRRAVDRDGAVPADYRVAARLQLATAYLESGGTREAREQIEAALADDGDSPRAHFLLGLLEYTAGNLRDSRQHLERAAGSPTARRKAAAQLAVVCRRLGDEKAAAEHARRAGSPPEDAPWPDPFTGEFEGLPRGRQAQFKEAEQLAQRGEISQAVALLREMAAARPDAQTFLSLGHHLSRAGAYAEAEQALEKAVQLNPGKAAGHYALGLTRLLQAAQLGGDPAKDPRGRDLLLRCLESLGQVLKLKPDDSMAHFLRGKALTQLGRRPEAVRAFQEAVAYQPDSADAHLLLGEVLAQEGRREEAIRSLENAARLAPERDLRARQALERVRNANASKH